MRIYIHTYVATGFAQVKGHHAGHADLSSSEREGGWRSKKNLHLVVRAVAGSPRRAGRACLAAGTGSEM